MDEINIYARGLCHCSVCVPEGMDRTVIEKQVNEKNPTGLDHGWTIDENAFVSGAPNPSPCNTEEGRLHYLMVC